MKPISGFQEHEVDANKCWDEVYDLRLKSVYYRLDPTGRGANLIPATITDQI